jgi:hypothetical protein
MKKPIMSVQQARILREIQRLKQTSVSANEASAILKLAIKYPSREYEADLREIIVSEEIALSMVTLSPVIDAYEASTKAKFVGEDTLGFPPSERRRDANNK